MAEWSYRYRSRSMVITRYTPSHAIDHLCLIWHEYIHNCRHVTADTIECAIFHQIYCKVIAELPWRYRSGSKIIKYDAFPYASDNLCQVWKDSIQNCRRCRAHTTGYTGWERELLSVSNAPVFVSLIPGWTNFALVICELPRCLGARNRRDRKQ